MEKNVTGRISVSFLLDCEFEGDFWIEMKRVQVMADKYKLKIVINGTNGGMEIELNQNKETL
ncbi:hypothetical protein DRP05_06735 [Archaeoglobales archaeon]|nr:MAG: hypothetical protein DRP05_06735 [Archaeoglobales archaeon]